MFNMASATGETHRREVAQLAGEATRALQEQAREHADVQARLQRESVLKTENMASYMSVKQAALSQEAQVALAAIAAEMQQHNIRRDEEVNHLLLSLSSQQT